MTATTHTTSTDWHNENALRAYPLEDDAPAAAVLPTWLITDMRVSVDSRYERVFLSSAYFSDTLVSIGVSGQERNRDGSWKRPAGLLVRSVTRDELEPFRTYGLDRVGSASGTVAFGAPPAGAPPFKLTFAPEEAGLVCGAVVRMRPPGVSSVVDAVHGTSAAGLIDLSGNSEFRTHASADEPGTVIIELTDLYRDAMTSVCSSSPSVDRCGNIPVRTVNGVPPDASGTIKLIFR